MSEHELLLSDFDFYLHQDRIAQFPLKDRSASRLLHVMPDRLEDWHFRDIVNLLRPDDLLVMNNTKVIKARLLGKKETGGAVEVLIERITGENTAIAMARASKSPKAGTYLVFEAEGKEERVEVTGREGEFFALRFEHPVLEVLDFLEKSLFLPTLSTPPIKAMSSVIKRFMRKRLGLSPLLLPVFTLPKRLSRRLRKKGFKLFL